MTWRQCLDRLGQLWEVERPPQMARLELLLDERNAMQHRFGTVDPLTMDYHMGSVFMFLQYLMNREFAADLHSFLRENLPESVWRKCRYVKDENQSRIERARSLVSEGDATSGLLEAFGALEGSVLAAAMTLHGRRPSSTLDVLMKYGDRLAEAGRLPRKELPKLADAYRLRNAAVHGNEEPPASAVLEAIRTAELVVAELNDAATHDALRAALAESNNEIRERSAEVTGPGLSEEELLRVIAERQLLSPPPRFVGFRLIARHTNSQGRLQAMVDDGLLIVYHVPNPDLPEFPTAAVRLNTESSAVQGSVDGETLNRLAELVYP